MDITGHALIVGGGSGIGKGCALGFAKEGAASVTVVDIDLEAALKTSAECKAAATRPGFQSRAIRIDVTHLPEVEAGVTETVSTFGRIDYCVNCAGIGAEAGHPMAEADAAEFGRFLHVNVTGTFNVTRAVTAAMKMQEPQPVRVANWSHAGRGFSRGAIVNLGSAASYVASPGIVHYTASKHAVLGLSKNAALDHVADGIRVNCLCPTWVDTPMVQKAMAGIPDLEPMIKSMIPMGRIACVDEVADAALFLCSPRSSYITGSGMILDGGTTLSKRI